MRTNDYKEDVIKFDDIEWLTELSKAEKKVKNDLLTTNDYDRGDDIRFKDYSYILYIGHDDNINDKSIGKIAGWDLSRIEMIYVKYNSNNYVYHYDIYIKDYEKSTDLEVIKKDLVEKLDNKYGKDERYTNNDEYEYEWMDKNGNIVGIEEYGHLIHMIYECTNIREYFEKLDEEY